MEAYRSHYRWDCGLHIRDWRYFVRICNIDVSDLLALTGTQAITAATSILKLMTKALDQVPNLNGRAAFYVSRTARQMLRLLIIEKIAGSTLAMDTVAGKRVLTFGEVPVRRSDKISAGEAVVA